MNWGLVVLTSLLSSGVAVTAINAIANRRNLGATTERTGAETGRTEAETDEIIRKTYDGLLSGMRAELDRAVAKGTALEKRVAGLEAEREDQRRVHLLHASWDYMARERLPADFPDPPPLTPPIPRTREA